MLDQSRLAELLREMRVGLESLYGPRLRGLYLFGSYARGEADEESDVDLLVVLDRVNHSFGEIRRTGYLASEVSLKYGVTVSRTFTSEADWTSRTVPFLLAASVDARAA